MATASAGLGGSGSTGLSDLRRMWLWFVVLGLLLVIVGAIAVARACAATVVSMAFFGWLLVIGGALAAVGAFWRERGWGGFFLNLLFGILYLVVGLLVVANPVAAAEAFTLLFAVLLIFGGLFRIMAGLAYEFPHRGWIVVLGILSLLLGIAVLAQWPVSGLWFIGLCVGLELMFNGVASVALGLTLRSGASGTPDS